MDLKIIKQKMNLPQTQNKTYFKAIIRVVKSIALKSGFGFDTVEVLREPIIEATNKDEVKTFLAEKYPQFFPNAKVYERETKDQAQFFYVVIYPLYAYEIKLIEEGEWVCASCGHIHENKYFSKPRINERLFGPDKLFCKSDEDICVTNYWKNKNNYNNVDLPDDTFHIKSDSLNYIYKCTEKSSGKCYIGKTRNAPFFRWWNHLTKSNSPFGLHLRQTKLSDWSFEVLEELPSDLPDSEILRIESQYILKFNSIHNGFNTVLSNKKVLDASGNLFDNIDND